MIKYRFLSVFIFLAFLLACVPFQASADEDEYELQKINVLDYGFPNGKTVNQAFLNAGNNFTATYTLPFSYPIIFVDVIFESSEEFTAVGVRGSSGAVEYLNFTFLQNGLHRATGELSRYFGSGNIGFTVLSANGSNVTIHRFDLYTYTNQGVGDIGELMVVPDAQVFSGEWVSQSSAFYPLNRQFYYFGSAQFNEYNAYISSVNWRKYDYLDFQFTVRASDITYISAYIGESKNSGVAIRYLPFDITFVNPSAIDKNEYIGTGEVNPSSIVPVGNEWEIIMRVYISREMTLGGSLKIHLHGNYANAADSVTLSSVKGYYYLNVPDPELVKLDQMIAAIKESLSSSEEDNVAAEDFAENMTSQKEQMASNQQTLNNVSKPSSEDLGMMASPDAVLNADGMTALVSIINPITDNDLVLGILTLSATLALVSYVFFGKKR